MQQAMHPSGMRGTGKGRRKAATFHAWCQPRENSAPLKHCTSAQHSNCSKDVTHALNQRTSQSAILSLSQRASLPKCPWIQKTIYVPGDIPQTLCNETVNSTEDIINTAVLLSNLIQQLLKMAKHTPSSILRRSFRFFHIFQSSRYFR